MPSLLFLCFVVNFARLAVKIHRIFTGCNRIDIEALRFSRYNKYMG